MSTTALLAAGTDDLTSKASTLGLSLLGVALVIALIIAFMMSGTRRWAYVLGIVAMGAVVAMIVSDPSAMLQQAGNFAKVNIWDPIIGSL
ncbi:hypothetical protein GS504_01725 [Rhodococcus hoagii]|nr:hypothetical protein [Prescottella equi]NKS71610.1 hypothetical protein [Prescottella equi]